MTRFWTVTVMATFGRMVAIAGGAVTVGTILAFVGEWVFLSLRYAPDWNVGILPLVAVLQLAVAGWVVWGVARRDARTLLRNLLVAFALSFLLSYGWYFLLLGEGLEMIAVGNLLYLLAALPVAVAALGDARPPDGIRREAIGREVRMGTTAFGAILFVALATIAGYASIPPPEARAISPPDEPACPEYLEEEIAAFRGSGDRTTPAFEASGYWGYEYGSAGYSAFRITVLDEDGDVVYGADEPTSPAGSVGGGEFASGGAFRLEIEADEDAKYAVVVCDGANPSGGNRDRVTSVADTGSVLWLLPSF
jgi:hypothetical protein